MRIRPLLGLFALVLGSTSVLLASDVHAQLRRIAIGSNPAGTNYYVVAGGIAKFLQEETRIPAIVRPFSGSSVYIPMPHRGEPHGLVWVAYDENGKGAVVRDQGGFHNGVHPARGSPLVLTTNAR
ncbi:MAG: hypothetical protein AAEI08_05965 [Gammaproteobacteria bacterium]